MAWLGIDIGQTAVRGVRISSGRWLSSPEETFAQPIVRAGPTPPYEVPSEGQKQALRQLVAHGKIRKKDEIILSLPGHLALIYRLVLPLHNTHKWDVQKLRQVIPYEIEERLPYSLDEVILDFMKIEATEEGMGVLVCAVPRSVLERYQSAFEQAEISISRVHVAPLMRLSVLPLTLARQNRATHEFFLDIGAMQTSLCYLHNGRPAAVRALPMGGDLLTLSLQDAKLAASWQEAEQMKYTLHLHEDSPVAETLRRAMQPWKKEVEKTILGWCNIGEATKESRALYLTGGGAKLGGLAAEWDMPVSLLPASDLSLCTRRGRETGIDLCPHPSAASKGMSTPQRWAFGFSLAVICGLAVADLSLRYHDKESSYQEAKRLLQKQFSAVFPHTPHAGSEIEYLHGASAQLTQMANRLALGKPGALHLLRALAETIPEGLPLEVQELAIEEGKIRMEAKTDAYVSIDRMRAHLIKNPLFLEVALSDAKVTADNAHIGFRMQIRTAGTPLSSRID